MSNSPTPEEVTHTAAERRTIGGAEVVGRIGAGGMGEVLLVLDPTIGRRVAAKTIRGQATAAQSAAFVRELQIAGQLEHPGIVPVYAAGCDDDGRPWFTMKRVVGRELGALLDLARVEDLPRLLPTFLKVCEAVAYAHSKGVIHRDLKPSNVMVGDYGEVYVMDWGLAKELESAEGQVTDVPVLPESPLSTVAGTVKGTPGFMAPEQARGEIEGLDARCDQYALGAILYQLVAGRSPYEGRSTWEVLAQVSSGPPPPPSAVARDRRVPHELEAIVQRAMAFDREQRYRSVEALILDITAYLGGERVRAARYRFGERGFKWLVRHRRLLGAGIAAAILTAAAAVGLSWRQRSVRIESARSAVRALDPASLLDEVARALPAGDAVRPPSDEERRTWAPLIVRMLAARDAMANLAALDPESGDEQQELLLALGALARASEDFALAEAVLRDAARGGADAGPLLAGLERARDARRVFQIAAVRQILDQVRDAGAAVDERAERQRVLALATHREPHCVAVLTAELDRITAVLRAVTLREMLAAADSADTATSRAVIEAWLAAQRPESELGSEPALDEGGARQIEAIQVRLGADRALVARQQPAWQMALAAAQLGELRREARGGDRLAPLVCDALALIGSRDAIGALEAYLYAEWNELRAIPAAVALIEIDRDATRVGKTLRALAGLVSSPGGGRWEMSGQWWTHVSHLLEGKDVGEPSEARDPEALAKRGLVLLEAGANREAIEVLTQAIQLDDLLDGARVNRGVAYRAVGELESALADFEAVIRRNPAFAPAYVNRGVIAHDRGDTARARADYDRAIELDGASLSAHMHRGRLRADAGDLVGAKADFDRMIELDPSNAVAFTNRGFVLRKGGDLEGAVADYTRALELDPRSPLPRVNRALALRALGRLAESLADLDRALELAPDLVAARVARAKGRRLAGDPAGAVADLDRAVALEPGVAKHRYDRAVARRESGDLAGALEDIDAVDASAPGHSEVIAERAEIHGRAGRTALALADADRAVALSKGRRPEDLKVRGRLLLAAGRGAEAAADFEAAAQLVPSDWQAWLGAGRAWALVPGRTDRTLACLRQARERAPVSEHAAIDGLVRAAGGSQ